MITQQLYLDHCYDKEFNAKVLKVTDGKFILLDKTLFYTTGGGQPHDTGTLTRTSDNEIFNVVFTGKFNDEISHEVNNKNNQILQEDDEVHGEINWERRYKIMRAHTAAHLMCAIIDREEGKEGRPVKFTGSQLEEEKSRFDVNLQEYNPEKLQSYIEIANKVIKESKDVIIETKPREEALKDPSIVKLAKGFDESIEEVRLVKINDIDLQPCGGTHLKNISEIGKIIFLKAQNKGAGNRRIYYTVE